MKFTFSLILAISLFSFYCLREINGQAKKLTEKDIRTMADSLAKNIIIVDTHIDVPYRLAEKWEDISKRTAKGNFDYPRAIRGGLNVAFMSIYTPADLEAKGTSKTTAEKLITMVENLTKEYPYSPNHNTILNDVDGADVHRAGNLHFFTVEEGPLFEGLKYAAKK